MKLVITENQFKQIISLLKESTNKKLNVLFVGDSLSAGQGYTWNYLLDKKHKSDWNTTHRVKGGEITEWMVNQVRDELQKKHYDMVFVYGGTNDMFSAISVNSALSNLKKIIDMVAEQGGKTYIYSGYDVESSIPSDLNPTYYKSGKLLCSKECMIEKRQKMIDFQNSLGSLNGPNSVVIPPTNIGQNSFSKQDQIHPSGSAHSVMASEVDSYISGNIPEPKETSYLETLMKIKKGSGGENMLKNLLSDLENFKSNNDVINYKGTIISNDDVFQIQTGLQLLGYSLPVWGIDGKFGPETKSAVQSLQKDLGLDPDGIVDSELIDDLIGKLKSTNISDSDFKELSIEKQSSISYEEPLQGGSTDFDFNAVINNSIISKFKEVLDENNLSYADFVSKCKKIGLNSNIAIAQLYAESAFNPLVIDCSRKSSAGAKGIAQFMPRTWPEYGEGGDPCVVKDALDAYIRLMDKLINMFPNRIDLSIAGYNSGPYLKIYKEALKNNIPFEGIKNKIPSETRGYVKKILGLG
jgi:lysophospholipase L1-like esterase